MGVLAFDIDGVLCSRAVSEELESTVGPEKYRHCQPMRQQIGIVNAAYDAGHEIVLYTARGMAQFEGDAERCDRELRRVTEESLVEWGVKYHRLVFGKIYFDVLVDDKALNSADVGSVEDLEIER